MHFSPYGEDALAYDAVGLEFTRRGERLAGRLARLAAPGYSEWDLSAGWSGRGGIALEASLLAAQPSDRLFSAYGIRSLAGFSLSGGYVRSWGERLRLFLWARDALRSPACGSFGLRAIPSTRVEVRTGTWVWSVTRDWDAAVPDGGSLSAALEWSPAPSIRLQQGWSRTTSSHLVAAACDRLGAAAWKVDSDEGLPTVGVLVSFSCPRSEADHPGHGPQGTPAATNGCEDVPEGPRPSAAGCQAQAVDLWTEAVSRLRLDEGRIAESLEADSLGEWSDSLASEDSDLGYLPVAVAASVPRSEPPPARGEDSRHRPPRPLSGIDALVLSEVCGTVGGAAEELARCLGTSSAASLGEVVVPPSLRPALRQAAPYLTARGEPAAGPGGRSGFLAASPEAAGPVAASWRHDSAGLEQKVPRSSEAIEIHSRRGGLDLATRMSFRDRDPTRSWRGNLVATGRWWTALAGRSSRPFSWGTGLIAHAAPPDLRSGRTGSGAVVRSEGRSRSPLLLPGLSGSDAVFGCEVRLDAVGLRAAVAREGTSNWVGLRGSWGAWTGGLLARTHAADEDAASFWIGLQGAQEETSLEVARVGSGVPSAGLRWAGRRELPPPLRSGWWDLRVQERLPAGDLSEALHTVDGSLFLRGLHLGVRPGPGGSATADVEWSARARGGAAAHTARGALRASGRRQRSIVWSVQANGIFRWVTPLAPFSPSTASASRTGRLRVAVDSAEERARGRGGRFWRVEAGAEGSLSRSAAGTERRRGATWAGIAAGRRLRGVRSSLGVEQVDCFRAYKLNLAPSWVPGSRFPFRGRGLWAAAGLETSLGPVCLGMRGVLPCFVDDRGGARAASSWELRIRTAWGRSGPIRRDSKDQGRPGDTQRDRGGSEGTGPFPSSEKVPFHDAGYLEL